MKLHVPDMSCGHCVAAIKAAVTAEEADAPVSADLTTRTVEIGGTLSVDAARAALLKAGYDSALVDQA